METEKIKYQVRRADGKKDDIGADYFILRLDKGDHASLFAVETYARLIQDSHPEEAQVLRDKIKKYRRGPRVNLE